MTDESYNRIINITERHVQYIKEHPIAGVHDEELISSYEKAIEEAKKILKDSGE